MKPAIVLILALAVCVLIGTSSWMEGFADALGFTAYVWLTGAVNFGIGFFISRGASKRGGNSDNWLCFGILFGVIALAVYGLWACRHPAWKRAGV